MGEKNEPAAGLTAIAVELLNTAKLPCPEAPDAILRPSWESLSRVHDWRNYIPDALRESWLALSPDARVAAYIMAEQAADLEEWD